MINNILLFVPFGALLYSINPKLFFVVPLLTVSIEAIQYFAGLGLCELDDIFGNTFGGFSGWGIMLLLNKRKQKNGYNKE